MSNFSRDVKILDIPFINKSKEQLLKDDLYPRLKRREKTFVVTANPEIVMYAHKDRHYKDVIVNSDYVVADGIGIVFASRWRKAPLNERIAGFDLMIDLLEFANKERLRCYFLGAKEEVNERAVNYVKETYPNIAIAGSHHGYFSMDDDSVVEQVRESKPDLVFVALGFPKQELWIEQYYDQFTKGLFIGVGGSFDVLAQEVKRAPKIWITLHLEWLYRLIKQPARIFRMVDLFKFVFIILFKKERE